MQCCDKSEVGTNNIYNDFDDEWSVTLTESIYCTHGNYIIIIHNTLTIKRKSCVVEHGHVIPYCTILTN